LEDPVINATFPLMFMRFTTLYLRVVLAR
jgi:hypothetical protein